VLKSFRFEIWSDGSHDMCAIRAEMPESAGLTYLWFVMSREEFLGLTSGRMTAAVDCSHHVHALGDTWRFYDLDFPSADAGSFQVKYYNLTFPRFLQRMLVKVARKVWAYKRATENSDKQLLEISPARMAKYVRLYGTGSGQVKLDATPETLAQVEKFSEDPKFVERLEYLKRIARNSTQTFWQTATLYLSADRHDDSGLYWTAVRPEGRSIMNGGLVKHRDGEWGVHT